MMALPASRAGITLAVASEMGAFQGTIAAVIPYGTFLISATNDLSDRCVDASSLGPTSRVCFIWPIDSCTSRLTTESSIPCSVFRTSTSRSRLASIREINGSMANTRSSTERSDQVF